MEKIKQALVTWFNSKSDSEQRLVKLASAVFVVFAFFTLATSISSGVNLSEKKLRQQLELNAWAKQQISLIKGAGSLSATPTNNQSITQVINATAKKYRVQIERLQPQKDDLVKVGINEIGFNNLMRWLTELQTRHNIHAQNIDFSKADTQGMVKIRRLDLGRG